VSAFNEANRFGLTKIDEVVAEKDYPPYDLLRYYTENISYQLDKRKKEGLTLFLQKLGQPQIA
jgi:chorismate dehydratase